ncbi:aldehyde dehydrogenase family protein [Kangiella profundi]|uniref:aldehyde dehydrogenase (NAD(+)) n=1 Tax=Kangiella profundi TaxID=1561924 RepID=A0A2K9AXY5_9GAMM|nr:aldehyde dehydrogenase family protein [Kangiella profundi]AUD78719.1 aldehyde dehydrogenase family protein [Kangiella profundi]GGE90025.1 aldehyde dehydrogenase [Kangiella profundi]
MDFLKELGIEAVNQSASWGQGYTDTQDAGVIESINPATGEVIAKVNASSATDYDKVMQEAEAAFEEWRKVPAPLRGELVRKIGNALREHKDALGSLVSAEMGKIKAEGDGEVQEMIDMADFAVGQSRMLYGKTMHSERPEHRMYEQWHPLGITGVMSAFNFPVAVWSWNAFIAAICGNTVVWKPSPKTPLTAIAVQNICNKVLEEEGLKGIFCLFIDTEENKLSQRFIEDARVKKMSFTGSSEIGRMVGVKVAERMGKSLLELSGNNALILDKTADMDIAVPAIVFGAVGTAGQRCTSTRRLIVHKDVADQVIPAIVNAYKQVKIGNPLDTNTLMGPLVDANAVKNFENAVAKAKEAGGEVLAGGKAIDGPGFFIEPTVIRAENHWDVVQTETFASILYVMTYETTEEAIAMQNHSKAGLSSAIFTRDMKVAEKFLSAQGSDCGIANVNIGTSGAEIGGAFGGEKETGGGREAGSDAWKAYMRRQTNTIFWGDQPTLAQGIKFDLG